MELFGSLSSKWLRFLSSTSFHNCSFSSNCAKGKSSSLSYWLESQFNNLNQAFFSTVCDISSQAWLKKIVLRIEWRFKSVFISSPSAIMSARSLLLQVNFVIFMVVWCIGCHIWWKEICFHRHYNIPRLGEWPKQLSISKRAFEGKLFSAKWTIYWTKNILKIQNLETRFLFLTYLISTHFVNHS